MQLYHYDPVTGEYTKESAARLDPLESKAQQQDIYLIPAHATNIAPPDEEEGMVRVFDGEAWSQVEDHRGETAYSTADESITLTITELGPIPDGYTLLEPCDYPTWNGSEWVSDFSQALAAKIESLAAYRYEKETAGITVNGSTIRTDRESQSLIAGAKLYSDLNESILIDWKAENGWVQIDRNAIVAISQAVAAHVQACFSNEKVHSSAINALTTVEEIEAYDITTGWPV